jgi:hypothetical protein
VAEPSGTNTSCFHQSRVEMQTIWGCHFDVALAWNRVTCGELEKPLGRFKTGGWCRHYQARVKRENSACRLFCHLCVSLTLVNFIELAVYLNKSCNLQGTCVH